MAQNIYLRTLTPYYFMSFPKSGRTWVKSFLANYYAAYLDIPLFYDFAPLWRSTGEHEVPRIIFEHGVYRAESDDRRRRFLSRVQGKKVILLSRDPRKVIFSYYFRLTRRMRIPQVGAMTMSQFIRDDVYGIKSIVRFLNDWSSACDRLNGFMLLRYEDCVERPEKEFATLLDFLDTPVDPVIFRTALGHSVDTTRKIEESDVGRDDELRADISRGPQYFEALTDGEGSAKRYAGDQGACEKLLTEADASYMENEMLRLNSVFNYCAPLESSA